MTAIHVRFARLCDADSAVAELPAYGLHHEPKLTETDVEVECRAGEEDEVLLEVSHALDDWLDCRHLPFTPEQTDSCTLVVRPPAG
jgi:hypothetical protein